MTISQAFREIPQASGYDNRDALVLFGELFSAGYANGLVERAQKAGMKIIHSTVGRRDKDGQLRPLNTEELKEKPNPIINIPLEAGFDMYENAKGESVMNWLQGYKMSEWTNIKLDWDPILVLKREAHQNFIGRVHSYMKELEPHLEGCRNVIFAHTMAGGVPRAKIIMPVMNKVFKGKGDRFISSEDFWQSDLGWLCRYNFEEVTAMTFKVLVDGSSAIREKITSQNGNVSYLAYGYHGTETLIKGEYKWQTYTPYLQGWAKIKLEDLSKEYKRMGLNTCVYNCPEILTNSSSIFQGIEVSLYPLLGALKKEYPEDPKIQEVIKTCADKLKPEHTIDDILKLTDDYMTSPIVLKHSSYENWPQHNSKEQMENMMEKSQTVISWHKDPKDLSNVMLSELVFRACGLLMFRDVAHIDEYRKWIGHDILAKSIQYILNE